MLFDDRRYRGFGLSLPTVSGAKIAVPTAVAKLAPVVQAPSSVMVSASPSIASQGVPVLMKASVNDAAKFTSGSGVIPLPTVMVSSSGGAVVVPATSSMPLVGARPAGASSNVPSFTRTAVLNIPAPPTQQLAPLSPPAPFSPGSGNSGGQGVQVTLISNSNGMPGQPTPAQLTSAANLVDATRAANQSQLAALAAQVAADTASGNLLNAQTQAAVANQQVQQTQTALAQNPSDPNAQDAHAQATQDVQNAQAQLAQQQQVAAQAQQQAQTAQTQATVAVQQQQVAATQAQQAGGAVTTSQVAAAQDSGPVDPGSGSISYPVTSEAIPMSQQGMSPSNTGPAPVVATAPASDNTLLYAAVGLGALFVLKKFMK